MTRVVIFVAGTEGDVRPHVALGVGLVRVGHDVSVVTSREFEVLVRAAGLGFAPLSADFGRMMIEDRARFDGKPQWWVVAHGLRRVRAMTDAWVAEGLAPARGAGLIIGSGVALYLAASIAEALGIAFVRTMLQPIEPAREWAPMLVAGGTSRLPGRVNLGLHWMARNLTWQMARQSMARVRRQLGLRPYPMAGPWRALRDGRARLLNAFSPVLVPPSADWGPDVATTGAWVLRGEERPSAALVRFVEAGPPPVYVGFGSMVARDAERLGAVVGEALARTGRRAVVAGEWPVAASERVFVTGHVPHDWLLRRVSAAVHHCGAGTTHAVLGAGVPSVPVPFLLDQFFWARRLAALGVAVEGLRRGGLEAGALAGAIEAAHEGWRVRRAAEVGAQVGGERGVEAAIAALGVWGVG